MKKLNEWWPWLLIPGVVVFWWGFPRLLIGICPNCLSMELENFTSLDSFFSLLGFVGLLIAAIFQRKELQLQRLQLQSQLVELELSRKVFSEQREEMAKNTVIQKKLLTFQVLQAELNSVMLVIEAGQKAIGNHSNNPFSGVLTLQKFHIRADEIMEKILKLDTDQGSNSVKPTSPSPTSSQ